MLFEENLVSRYVSSRNFVRLRFGRLIAVTGISRIVQLVSGWNPGYIGENRIAKGRFEEDGSWSCVGNIERRFVIARFVFLSVCNGDCVRTDRGTM